MLALYPEILRRLGRVALFGVPLFVVGATVVVVACPVPRLFGQVLSRAAAAPALMLFAVLLLVPLLPQGFQPAGDPDFLYVDIQGPPGATVADMETTARRLNELFREQPIDAMQDGKWLSGIIDRLHLHRDPAGEVTRVEVIDFKTDAVDDLQQLLARCLDRNFKHRYKDISEARIAIDQARLLTLHAAWALDRWVDRPARTAMACGSPSTAIAVRCPTRRSR